MGIEDTENNIHPNSSTQEFLDKLNSSGATPMEKLSPNEARKVLEGAQLSEKIELPEADVTEKFIEAEGLKIKLFIVRPQGTHEKLPAFMFFHGGGWVIGDFPTHERLVRDLVVESGLAAVFVEYSRSPESPFPTAINEGYAATKWVAEHGDEINIDGSRLAVVGNSAGGNLATAVAQMAKQKDGPSIRFQVLFWPVTNANFETESYQEFAEGHFLTRNMMMYFWDNYLKDVSQRGDILASPLLAARDDLRDLPPALIQTAECDVLRDEGEAYARKLDEAGVSVTVTRYVGMIHDFGLLNPLSQIPEVKSHILQAAQELKKYLQLH